MLHNMQERCQFISYHGDTHQLSQFHICLSTCLYTLNIGDCNFERGLCNWKNWVNEVQDQFDWIIGTAPTNLQHRSSWSTTGEIIGILNY